MSLVLSCKSDSKKSDQLDSETAQKLNQIKEQFKKDKERRKKRIEGGGLLSSTTIDPSFPKSSILLSAADIGSIFGIDPADVKITADEYEKDRGFSRTVWNWNDASDSFHKLTVVMNRNPSPDDMVNWGKLTLDHYLQKGIPYTDGSMVMFKDIRRNGNRYIWAEQGPMLKWFYVDEIAFTFVGLGPDLTEKNLLQSAEKMLQKLEALRK